MLNFKFPYTEIRCSSFPPPCQLVSSSPVSACFHPSLSMFSILTALFVCSSLVCAWIDSPSSSLVYSHPHPLYRLVSSLCMLSSVFVLVRRTHTPLPPHLQAVLTTDSQAYACLCVLLSSLILICCIHTPPFSPHLQAVDFPFLLLAFIVLTPSFPSSPESLCFSPPSYMFVILTTPLALLVSR